MKPRKINLDFKEYIRIKDTYNCITIGEEENAVTIRFFKNPSMYTKLDKECKKDEPLNSHQKLSPLSEGVKREGNSPSCTVETAGNPLGNSGDNNIEDEIKQELQKDYDVVPRTSEVKE